MPEVHKLLKKLSDAAQKVATEITTRTKAATKVRANGLRLYEEQREQGKLEATDAEMKEMMGRVADYERKEAHKQKSDRQKAKDGRGGAKEAPGKEPAGGGKKT